MGITGIETSLKMFEKFLSSEGGLKIAHKYSEDIRFGLNELQTIPKSHRPPTAALGQPPACVRLPSVQTERLL